MIKIVSQLLDTKCTLLNTETKDHIIILCHISAEGHPSSIKSILETIHNDIVIGSSTHKLPQQDWRYVRYVVLLYSLQNTIIIISWTYELYWTYCRLLSPSWAWLMNVFDWSKSVWPIYSSRHFFSCTNTSNIPKAAISAFFFCQP